jgi:hypothetical protein
LELTRCAFVNDAQLTQAAVKLRALLFELCDGCLRFADYVFELALATFAMLPVQIQVLFDLVE